jgi:hypothetical protein
MALVDELIERYDAGAILRVAPYVDDSGQTLRWFVEIDGENVYDVDVAIRDDPDRDGGVVVLVSGDEEVENRPLDEDDVPPRAGRLSSPSRRASLGLSPNVLRPVRYAAGNPANSGIPLERGKRHVAALDQRVADVCRLKAK